MLDEVQAHLIANFNELVREGLDKVKYEEIQKSLSGLYDKYSKGF